MFSENVQNASSIEYSSGKVKALSQLGLAYYLQGNYDKSTDCYIKTFQILEQSHDYDGLAGVYGEYGYQLKRRDLSKAIHYMRLAVALAEENRLGDDLKCKLYDNYGVLKEMQSDFDSAMVFYDKALLMKIQRNDSVGIPYSLNKIAGLKAAQKKFGEAYNYIRQSDRYRANEQGEFGRAENLSVWADIFRVEGKTDSSIHKYEQCLQLARSLGYTYLQQYCYQQLAESYKAAKDFAKALERYQFYIALKDSTLNQQTRATIAQLEIAYETAEKDKLLVSKELDIKQRTLLLILAGGSIVFLILLSVWIYKYQMQKRERLEQELELRNRLREVELENKISSEKLRISRELHDNIGSRLAFIVSSLDNMAFAHKMNAIVSRLSTLSSFSRETLDDLRNTIWAMKNEDGTIAQLILKTSELVQKLTTNGIQIDVHADNTLPERLELSSVQMLNLFRVVQEAIQNSLRHSRATKISVYFQKSVEGFSMRIQDNGKGFDKDTICSGSGISNMKARCEEASGRFQLHSSAEGTYVECFIRLI